MSARTSRRRSLVSGEVFRTALSTNYRFWAAVRDVHAVLFLADPRRDGDKLIASVERPVFPPGVCTGCGCSEFDACLTDSGAGCSWIDAEQTRCSQCGPVPRPRKAKR